LPYFSYVVAKIILEFEKLKTKQIQNETSEYAAEIIKKKPKKIDRHKIRRHGEKTKVWRSIIKS